MEPTQIRKGHTVHSPLIPRGTTVSKRFRVSSLEVPPVLDLKEKLPHWTKQVTANTPYHDSLLSEARTPRGQALFRNMWGPRVLSSMSSTSSKRIVPVIRNLATRLRDFCMCCVCSAAIWSRLPRCRQRVRTAQMSSAGRKTVPGRKSDVSDCEWIQYLQHPYLRSEPCSLRHRLGEAQSPALRELRKCTHPQCV